MRRRPMALVLTAALIGAVFTALPAQAAPEVPATVNVEDPAGDATYTSTVGAPGAVNFTRADILKVWFTNDATSISAHILTSASGNDADAFLYRVWATDPGTGTECLQFRGFTAGAGNPGEASGSLRQTCDGDAVVAGEFIQEEGPDGTGIRTITLPRDAWPAFADGSVLKAPNADVTHFLAAVTAPTIDATDTGTDYTVAGSEPPVVDEPEAPKPPKNPCKKLKGKKKKKCIKKNKAPKACAAFTPGELGAEAETLVVTDAHTEEAPLEITLEHGPGAVRSEISRSHVFKNLQVDSAASEAGLYIRYEFPEYEDHDLYVHHADGSIAGQAAGFNTTADIPEAGPAINDGTSIGGHSETGAEVIDGLRTPDCGGYTVDFDNFAGEGGEYIAKVWLGEATNDAQPPASAATIF